MEQNKALIALINSSLPQYEHYYNILFNRSLNITGKKSLSQSLTQHSYLAIELIQKNITPNCSFSIIIEKKLLISLFRFNTVSAKFPTAAELENLLTNSLKNPFTFIPSTQAILKHLSKKELFTLINNLQQYNLVTPYHLHLLIQSFPDFSLKLKKSLPKNIVKDIIFYAKNKTTTTLSSRDKIAAEYAFAESIYFILKKGAPLTLSNYMQQLSSLVTNSHAIFILQKQSILQWFIKIHKAKLLYKILIQLNDKEIAACLYYNWEQALAILKDTLSTRKIAEIQQYLSEHIDFQFQIHSKLKLLYSYREEQLKQYNLSSSKFFILLGQLTTEVEFQIFLQRVGWFQFATALKNTNKSLFNKIKNLLPLQVKILVEDVLAGILNPNIIHDEKQIIKARIGCLESLISLIKDGLLDIDI